VRDEFRLGGADLGVDSERSSIAVTDSGVLTAELSAATVPAEASEWALAPPLLYFRSVALAAVGDVLTLTVDDDVLDEYDIALYFAGHHDVRGTLTLRPEGLLTFTGVVSDGTDPARQPTLSGHRETPISVRWTLGGAGT
jgi:hypothetical protein